MLCSCLVFGADGKMQRQGHILWRWAAHALVTVGEPVILVTIASERMLADCGGGGVR
jgi:hypothetical protein